MDRFPVMTLQPHVWAFRQHWAPPLSPLPTSPASPPPTPSGMSPKAKAFTIDALLGLRTQKDLPVSPPTSPVSVLLEDPAVRDAPGKAKRHRTVFTESQLQRLEEEFERNQYLVGPERRSLATKLQLSELQLKVWFQNRRIKWRKNQRSAEESTCSSSSDSE